ncbi:hypothetical protein [Hymenobacter sp. YC55]|uniref:hypothetical protein n=1 Tax=Hymenobacter sp. YC55 TaxID=3034019 RepID=UPI0023F6F71E|nr:hypothetical protein [Hymenobacter sp. YC55]MDF7810694.1 hypothetical protein [Hymenobacter sp. YC55]
MADLLKLGTVVADAIVPGNLSAAAQYSEYTQGGLHSGKLNLAAIYEITLERRQWGMQASTVTGETYELIQGLVSTNLADNGNWRLKPGGPGNGGPDVVQTTGTSTEDVMSQDAVTKELAKKVATTDPRLSDPRTPLAHTHTASNITDFTQAAGTVADSRIGVQKGQPGGLASLDGNGKVFLSQLPSYISDVQEYDSLAAFPATGTPNVIYVAKDTNLNYRWTGTQYTKIGDGQGVESFMGRTGNVVLTQADIDAFLVDLKARVLEAENDLVRLETDILGVDNRVDTIEGLIPANASPTNKLVTVADLSSGGGPTTTMQFNATRTVGGINAGDLVIVDNNASGQALKLILAPANAPSAGLSAQNPVRQPGASTAVVLNYSANKGTNDIATVVVAGQTVPPPSGTVNTSTAANTDTNFTMIVTDNKGMQAGASAQVLYRPLRFFGALSVDPLTLSDGDLSVLLRGLPAEFSDARQQTRSITANNEYMVFAGRAAGWAGAQYEVNGLSNNAFQGKTFNFTNSEGFTESFYVARGGQRLVGTFTGTVK